MKRLVLIIGFFSLFQSSSLFAQVPCTDSTRTANEYMPCGRDYQPVCGCDNKTYRNACAAFNWGGLYSNSWTDGTVCGNFDFDFFPTAIDYYPSHLNIFMKSPGSAVLYIYDTYGRLKYSEYYSATYPAQIIQDEIPVQNLLLGIYIVAVVVGEEIQYKKFAKVTNFN
ncbi:MAG: hypothetical protein IPO39_12155 [Bacteroidetes bacterium]|nr:hypothetical protein [Bacteroidota bacterium]